MIFKPKPENQLHSYTDVICSENQNDTDNEKPSEQKISICDVSDEADLPKIKDENLDDKALVNAEPYDVIEEHGMANPW